jgi:Haemolymph juvenile hormone binding protein (JHBP)
MHISPEGSKGFLKMYGSNYKNGTKTYIKIDKVKINLKVGSLRTQYNNLFNGWTILEKVANALINRNIDTVTKEANPFIEQSIEAQIKVIVNQFFQHGSRDEFFPPTQG